jgi:ATP synthase protein I
MECRCPGRGLKLMARDDKSSKFDDLEGRIRKLRQDSGLARDDEPERPIRPRGYGAGVQIGVELLAGILVGGFLGYWLDRWLETWPIFFMVMFFAGAGAGMLNAFRYISRMNKRPDPPSGG